MNLTLNFFTWFHRVNYSIHDFFYSTRLYIFNTASYPMILCYPSKVCSQKILGYMGHFYGYPLDKHKHIGHMFFCNFLRHFSHSHVLPRDFFLIPFIHFDLNMFFLKYSYCSFFSRDVRKTTQ